MVHNLGWRHIITEALSKALAYVIAPEAILLLDGSIGSVSAPTVAEFFKDFLGL